MHPLGCMKDAIIKTIEFGRLITTCLTQLAKFNCPFRDYLISNNFFESVKLPAVIL